MRTLLSFCICCLALVSQVYAQPANQVFVSEKVFIAPINSFITNDDIIQIIGQILPTANTSSQIYSHYIYVELFDKQNSILQRQKIRCSNDGSFYTTMPIDKNIKAGKYYLRGYTQFMRNRRNSFYPTVPVYINHTSKHNNQDTALNVMCFPEGGHLVDGSLQNMCIYICNSCKKPQSKEYYIIKNNKDTIGHGSTDESGLSAFSYIPEHNAIYKLSLKDNHKEYLLPATIPTPTIKVSINKKRLICNILSSASDGTTYDDRLRLFVYHKSFGFKELLYSDSYAIADLSECDAGLMTIWLTDSTKKEIAQRTIWIGKNFGIADIEKADIKIQTNYKIKDTLSITIPENLYNSKVFIRFAPKGYKKNISAYSMLNFTNELFSPALFPSEIADDTLSIQKNAADIATWLLSAKQIMLENDILSRDTISYPYPIEKGLCISGTVYDDKEPMKNSSINIFNTSTKFATTTTTDTAGHFNAEVADYNKDNKFFIQAYNKDGQAGQYSYSIDEYEFPTIINMNSEYDLHHYTSDIPYTLTKDGINNLDEVVVTSKKINKKQYNWAKARGADFFSRDMLQKHPGWQTIADAIVFTNKVGVTNDRSYVYWKSGKYNRLTSSTLATSSDGTSQIGFAVNGFYINRDIADILNIQLSDVESLELVYSTDGRALWYGAPYGFYDVKLRSLMPARNIKSNGVTIQPLGLSAPTIPYECRLPEEPGQYQMLIDIITPNKQMLFVTKTIEVHE